MKIKKFLLIIAFIILSSISAITLNSVYASPYDYPIKPGSPEWKALCSTQQKVDCCQIPENILKRMTTEALVETVLNYPLLFLYSCYDDHFFYADIMEKDFNGYRELLNRKDINRELLKAYKSSKILTSEEAENSENYDLFSKTSDIEFLIAHSQIKGNILTTEEKEKFTSIMREKNADRAAYKDTYSIHSYEYDRFFEFILDKSKLENKIIVLP